MKTERNSRYDRKTTNGFTVVELAISIAVIAIILAIAVPCFINVVNKARRSSNIQAVRGMNTALIMDESVNGAAAYPAAASAILVNAGFDVQKYDSVGDELYWDLLKNRVLIYSDGCTVFPEDLASEYGETEVREYWYKLSEMYAITFGATEEDQTGEWSEWIVTKAATCTQDGEETRTYSNDISRTETRAIAATGHTESVFITDIEAGCETAGVGHTECIVCGIILQEQIIPALGHDWGEWETTKQATCTQAGEEARVCLNEASHIQTREIAATGHKYTDGICEYCGAIDPDAISEGLNYTLIYDNGSAAYSVTGIGYCSDTRVIIPSTYNGLPVATIGEKAFYFCEMESVIIESGVCTIEKGAFTNCINLTNVVVPDSVKIIGEYAFFGCDNLKSFSFPCNVTELTTGVFADCDILERITIPEQVSSIGTSAFYACACLTEIEFAGTMAQWEALDKGSQWNYNTGEYNIFCSDGIIPK